MKKVLLICSACLLYFSSLAGEIHIVTIVGNTFSPSTVTCVVGDSVKIFITAGHTATQVSQATWNANGTTPNGGFNYAGPLTLSLYAGGAGTYYYVCQNHVSMGMKGIIIVNTPTGLPKTFSENSIRTYPSLVSDLLHIEAPKLTSLSLDIFNLKGDLVYRQETVSTADHVSLSHLASGMYVGILTNKDRSYTWKFIKK